MLLAEPRNATGGTVAFPGPDPVPPPPPALLPEHREQLADAARLRRPLDRAARVATVSAWSLAVFAALSLPFAFFSLKGLAVAAGLIYVAVGEFRGRAALRRVDPRAPVLLARNQAALAAVLTVYCVWCMVDARTGPSLYEQAVADTPELAAVLEPMQDSIRDITFYAYGLILAVGLVVQALVIRYYLSRRRPLDAYLQNTPEWVRDLHLDRSRVR